jgi:hypothetical protein
MPIVFYRINGRRLYGRVAAILLGGVTAGSIDLGSAYLINGGGVGSILQTIAGGLLAERALSGGATTAALGAFLQEFMGVLIAAIYVLGCRFLPALARRWVISSLAYGVVIFLVMNYVVLPLCAWRYWPHFSVRTFSENLAAMLLFGLIVGYFAQRAESHRLDPV